MNHMEKCPGCGNEFNGIVCTHCGHTAPKASAKPKACKGKKNE